MTDHNKGTYEERERVRNAILGTVVVCIFVAAVLFGLAGVR